MPQVTRTSAFSILLGNQDGEGIVTSLERRRVPSLRPIAAKEISLIDRAEETKLLKEAVDKTVQGEGGLVFLHSRAVSQFITSIPRENPLLVIIDDLQWARVFALVAPQ